MIIPNYTPWGNKTSKPAPLEEVPLSVFKAAQRAGASHLSKDGKRAYCKRLGHYFTADYTKRGFLSWWTCEELPADAVELP